MENVSLIRDKKYILKDISWQVSKGDHWAIVGLNGSGKTTLLNIVNGYLWPSSGVVEVLGNKFGNTDIRELRKSIGWISSSFLDQLNHSYQRAINIVISGRFGSIGLHEEPSEEERETASRLMEKLGITYLEDDPFTILSQGEKQKVLMARALMGEPKLLVLDEPFTGLDLFAREDLLYTLQRLGEQQDGPAMIYVTHHVEEIVPVFNKIMLIKKGEIHSVGHTKELLTTENLASFFDIPLKVEWQDGRAWIKILSPNLIKS